MIITTENKLIRALSKSKEELIFVFFIYILTSFLIRFTAISPEIIAAFFLGGAFWGWSLAYIKRMKKKK